MLTCKNKLKTIELRKKSTFTIFFLTLIITILVINAQAYSNSRYDEMHLNDTPKTQSFFSKDDFSPIINEGEHGLGSIEITGINFLKQDEWVGFYNNSGKIEYEFYEIDISSDALNMTSLGIGFKKTLKMAQSDNLNENIEFSNGIVIELNETIDVKYDTNINSLEGYLLYGPRLYPCNLKQLQVQNESSSVITVNEGNYSIDENNFLKFDFLDFFASKDSHNFSMHLIWNYNLTISNWELNQYYSKDLIFQGEEQPLKPEFNYRFNILGKMFDDNSIVDKIGAEELDISVKINLPDKNLLNNHSLKLNDNEYDEDQTKSRINSDKSMRATFSANYSLFYLDFSTDFSIRFIDSVDDTWAIDRLVEQRNIRERIYFPRIISGPNNIFLNYIHFLEATIATDQIVGNTSFFEREFTYFDANVSQFEEELEDSLVFTENIIKKKGLKIQIPFMIKGEICPFSIKYEASEELSVKITDNIHMPISGLSLEVYYYGISYGTYISNNQSQPMAPITTDANGEILLENVPNGNYTLKFYQDGELVMESSVSAYREINYVVTIFPHFPLWIIIYGSINSIIFGFGFWTYRSVKIEKKMIKNKKKEKTGKNLEIQNKKNVKRKDKKKPRKPKKK